MVRWWNKEFHLVADDKVAMMMLIGGLGTCPSPSAYVAKSILELIILQPKSLFQLQAKQLASC